ncbi:alpha/beta hydrolase [Nakamurella alba]|nr:alpha/beta fold hydrolase [Nakamurella alba]
MWADGPGGWCFEWSRIADRYAESGQPWLASLAYGGARYPCLADRPKAIAMQHQIEQYVRASEEFPVTFERRTVTTVVSGEVVEVPVHLLAGRDATAATPVLLVSGGVDTWKMDLHQMWIAYVLGAGVRVLAFDHPGTGELTHVPLTRDSAAVVDGFVAYARTLTTGKVGHLGFSFGGWFAAHSSLTEAVDAAVVIGGPVTTASFGPGHFHELAQSMGGIVGNAFGFAGPPTDAQFLSHAGTLALDDLVAAGRACRTLVINGDDDPHVPSADLDLWRGFAQADVRVIPGGTHCAMNKLDELLPTVISWLRSALH